MNRKIKGTLLLFISTCLMAGAQTLNSPGGKYQMNFSLSSDGSPLLPRDCIAWYHSTYIFFIFHHLLHTTTRYNRAAAEGFELK